jgi:hypothetical protein
MTADGNNVTWLRFKIEGFMQIEFDKKNRLESKVGF